MGPTPGSTPAGHQLVVSEAHCDACAHIYLLANRSGLVEGPWGGVLVKQSDLPETGRRKAQPITPSTRQALTTRPICSVSALARGRPSADAGAASRTKPVGVDKKGDQVGPPTAPIQMKNEEEDVKPSPPPPAPGAPPPAPALAPLPHTVLVLQGKATLAGMSWEAKTVRASEATVHTAARTRGMRDRSKNAVFSVIVRGMGEVEDPGARTKEEARLRTALLKTRVPVFVLLQRGRLPALPLILEVTYDEARPRSAFGDLLASRLKMLGSQAPPPPPPPPPAPHRQPPPAASQHQQQHHAPLPTASRHDSSSGGRRKTWMGLAVLNPSGMCVEAPPPRQAYPSQEVLAKLKDKLPEEERGQVQLTVLSREDGERYCLRLCSDKADSPYIVCDDEGSEVGSVLTIEGDEDPRPPQQQGSLVLTGQVAEDMVDSLRVARTFVQLFEHWISNRLDQEPVYKPATANLKLHLCSAHDIKRGTSSSAAFALALVSLCWDTQLSGYLSSVSALREKALAAFHSLVGTDSEGSLETPTSSCRRTTAGRAWWSSTPAASMPPHAGWWTCRVAWQGGCRCCRLRPCSRSSPSPSPLHQHLVRPPPLPADRLAVTKTFLAGTEGAICQVIEVALLAGGTGKRMYSHNIQAGVRDTIEAGMTWTERRRETEVKAAYPYPSPRSARDSDFDLFFNIPGAAVQDHPWVSCSAVLAALSLLFQRAVPDDVAMVAESTMTGQALPPLSGFFHRDDTVLRLLITAHECAGRLQGVLERRPERLQGVEVLGVGEIGEAVSAIWGDAPTH